MSEKSKTETDAAEPADLPETAAVAEPTPDPEATAETEAVKPEPEVTAPTYAAPDPQAPEPSAEATLGPSFEPAPPPDDHPERAVLAAFAGGLVLATILKRLGS